jgi:hypothetical protein
VKPNTSAREAAAARAANVPTEAPRGQILIVEPDPLTQWSLKTYLERWFRVDATNSVINAQKVLAKQPVDALIVSEDLSPTGLASLEQRAHSFNARVAIVRTITDSSNPCRSGPHLARLEKPFALASLARLLGVPEDVLPGEP